MLKSARQMIAAAVLAGISLQANAMVVFDPTNFIENLISAMQSIAMEARQASQYSTQLQQYATQAKQVASLGSGAMGGQFNDIMNTYKTVQQYQSELAGLQGAVGSVKSVMDNRMRLMAASGLSWDQYLKREREGLKYRQDSNSILSAYERQTMDNAAQRYKQVQALQPQITRTQGTHESMQLMNGQMNMLTASMQDFITLSAAQGDRASKEAEERVRRETIANDEYDAFDKDFNHKRKESQSIIDALKNKKR